jgi:peroxiredoxin
MGQAPDLETPRGIAPPLAVGEHAPDVTLADSERQVVSLRQLWQARPLVLFFIRHFG